MTPLHKKLDTHNTLHGITIFVVRWKNVSEFILPLCYITIKQPQKFFFLIVKFIEVIAQHEETIKGQPNEVYNGATF